MGAAHPVLLLDGADVSVKASGATLRTTALPEGEEKMLQGSEHSRACQDFGFMGLFRLLWG